MGFTYSVQVLKLFYSPNHSKEVNKTHHKHSLEANDEQQTF